MVEVFTDDTCTELPGSRDGDSGLEMGLGIGGIALLGVGAICAAPFIALNALYQEGRRQLLESCGYSLTRVDSTDSIFYTYDVKG